jgi:hypothetical protein
MIGQQPVELLVDLEIVEFAIGRRNEHWWRVTQMVQNDPSILAELQDSRNAEGTEPNAKDFPCRIPETHSPGKG